jgi:feruloyl esterase
MLHRILLFTASLALGCTASRAEECGHLVRRTFGHAIITSAELVPAGTPIGSVNGRATAPAQFDSCRIQGVSHPTADSDIRFELWVPSGSSWNGKFEQVGNGGFAGSIPYGPMAQVLGLGYAVAGTDDGHESSRVTDALWAMNHPEKITDYGWRAIDETARTAKRILRELTARIPRKSYFVGCSDGGREALMMAQRFPTYFDGIVAGAPAYSMTRLLTGGAMRAASLGAEPDRWSTAQLELLQHAALQRCGNGAPYLKDPLRCQVDLDALKCAAGAATPCLSDADIKAARVYYAQLEGPVDGRPLYGVLPGAEAVEGGWDVWLTGTDKHSPPAGIAFTWNYLAYMVMNDPKLDLITVSNADLIRGARRYQTVMDADSADLTAFKAHGGKIIHYHGWNDPAVPPGYSLEYAARVAARTRGTADFYRLYMVPGMLHCGGGDAPTAVDWQAALEAWVERGAAPGSLSASDGKGDSQILSPAP